MHKPEFIYVTYIETTPEKLWHALTDGNFTERYWFGARLRSDWKVGSSFEMVRSDGTVSDAGKVVECDPPRRLAGLFLRVSTDPRRDIRGPLTEAAALADPDNTILTVSAGRDWARHEVTTQVPGDCDIVAFGTFMAGSGRIEMRGAELILGS